MANWKNLVGTIAPAIGTALGGPMAGIAISALGSVFGLNDASEEDLEIALANPTQDQLIALKKADIHFKERMKELEVDLEQIHATDRDSARRREYYSQDTWTPRILAAFTILSFIGCVVFVFYGQILGMEAAQLTLVGGVVGYASAKADTVIAYYFGSSKGSEEKNKILLSINK